MRPQNNETDVEIAKRLILKNKTKSAFAVDRYTRQQDWDVTAEKQLALERQQNQKRESNPFLNAYSVNSGENQTLLKSRAEDHLAERGWKRYPQPHERFYETIICPYGCETQVAVLQHNSPNVGEEDFHISIPLDLDFTDQYGNHTKRHTCSSQKYLVKRLENIENQNRELRNKISRLTEIINQNTRRY